MDKHDVILIILTLTLILLIFITISNVRIIMEEIRNINNDFDIIDCDVNNICEVIEELDNVTGREAIL